MSKILLIVVNDPRFFLSHRLEIAQSARSNGYIVNIASMGGEGVDTIRGLGFLHHDLPFSRSGKSPTRELLTLYFVWRLLWKLKPDLLHLVTIKPVLYGGIAARLAPVGGVVAAVSGLGFVFLSRGTKSMVLRKLVVFLYKVAFGKRNLKVIFQNADDRDMLISLGVLKEARTALIRGSGVNLSHYESSFENPGTPIVCMASRLLHDKGIVEYIDAARLLRAREIDATFQLIGDVDPGNPATVSFDELQLWKKEGVVQILGFRKDIANLFANAHIVTLPSYREGLPKVLVEAAACGRAVVTTDVPGCRDAIEPGETGLLVPVRDAEALAEALALLITDSTVRRKMGNAGRLLAEREFSIEKIVQQHLDIYRYLALNV
ncbi:glycosyl transferase family 1 [Pseudomonas agarici]|uniref:Glycosyl transferase family 1 n=3 Tax=Pseudomonas agarici TaxID=46677 RepID=A0A0X1T088_PSEAA|nr:glycosyltransferase family 4 protein [Pseudomonas agarici]AMB85219.1 glycosyl transferase family 1 [Pseudomonas agarici]NWC10860.1 glycosyltransferase family 4 protein [Pseudomonas agarici]SEK92053.1 Glycosyltransferase involved in cell wall bisynthesis [Pseudomonas agarici]